MSVTLHEPSRRPSRIAVRSARHVPPCDVRQTRPASCLQQHLPRQFQLQQSQQQSQQ